MGKITNLADVAAKHYIQEITLPGWGTDDAFVCRAKRPSLYNMASMGFVPNPLLGAIQAMFTSNRAEVEKIPVDKQAEVMLQMAKYALVEPTYDEIVAAGLQLTDDQLLNIYAFAIGGAAVLEGFRKLLHAGTGESGEAVPDKAEQAGED